MWPEDQKRTPHSHPSVITTDSSAGVQPHNLNTSQHLPLGLSFQQMNFGERIHIKADVKKKTTKKNQGRTSPHCGLFPCTNSNDTPINTVSLRPSLAMLGRVEPRTSSGSSAQQVVLNVTLGPRAKTNFYQRHLGASSHESNQGAVGGRAMSQSPRQHMMCLYFI